MAIVPLNENLVARVALEMREADRREIFACRQSYDPLNVSYTVMKLARFGGVAISPSGRPAAVVAAIEKWPGVYEVAMFATDEWPSIAWSLSRFVVQKIKPAMLAAGGHRAECRSIEGHDSAHRWLDWLGFRCEAQLPDCGKGRETFLLFAWRASDHVFLRTERTKGAGSAAAAGTG
jgi:hypothetical protein